MKKKISRKGKVVRKRIDWEYIGKLIGIGFLLVVLWYLLLNIVLNLK